MQAAAQPTLLPALRKLLLDTTHSTQTTVADAAAALAARLPDVVARYAPFASGVVRLEVPVARGATALHWLAGQEQGTQVTVLPRGEQGQQRARP